MEHAFLADLLVVFALGGAVVFLLRRLGLPPVVGLLVAGAAMGPHGMSLVADVHRVEVLAEIGVVLLLFTIGLEFSLGSLARMWRVIAIGGGGQVALTIGVVTVATLWRGDGTLSKPLFFGFLAALSSTAIVLRILGERVELRAPFGHISVGILLFQDLCIVPLMLVTPFLAGQGEGPAGIATALLEAAAVIVGVVFAARQLIPRMLEAVVHTRSRELFLTLILVLCLGTAWLTSLAGLSLALGAFLAGLVISESEFSHQVLAEAIPFRDAFGSLFFVSVGMLMDASFMLSHLPLVALAVAALVTIKTATVAVPTLLLGYPHYVALRVGLGLAQVGEFAFVLSKSGMELGLIDATEYQVFLSASVVTMLLTPGLIALGRVAAVRLSADASPPSLPFAPEPSPSHEHLSDHVVIAGYGLNGRNVARALEQVGIPHVVVEMNPEAVRSARQKGKPLVYGDCTRAAVLSALGIERARMYVVAISDGPSMRQTISLARTLSREVHILVRTRFVSELEELKNLGADEVIPEEFETSIEIFARVLDRFDVPRNAVLDQVSAVRSGMYQGLRSSSLPRTPAGPSLDALEGIDVDRLIVRGDSPVVGKTIAELAVRTRTGASILAVQRGDRADANPSAAFRLAAGDLLLVMGDQSALDAVLLLIDPSAPVS